MRTARCASRNSARALAFDSWTRILRGSVFSPRRTRNASNGPSDGPSILYVNQIRSNIGDLAATTAPATTSLWPRMSVIIIVGFAGVSTYTRRVFRRTASTHARGRRGSTKVVFTPNRGRRRVKISVVAVYRLEPDTT